MNDMLQRAIPVIVAIIIVAWILGSPAAAGDSVHGWISGVITFFHHVLPK